MIDRYATARAIGQERYRAVLEEDKKLLDQFGLSLLSVEHTVQVAHKKKIREGRINPWDVISIPPALWEWLRPTLVEMSKLRGDAKLDGIRCLSLLEPSQPISAK